MHFIIFEMLTVLFEFDKAIDMFLKGLSNCDRVSKDFSHDTNTTEGREIFVSCVELKRNIALVYARLQQHSFALECYLEANEHFVLASEKSLQMETIIGIVLPYLYLENYQEAMLYFNKMLENQIKEQKLRKQNNRR